MKRFFAILFALVFVLTSVPTAAFAVGEPVGVRLIAETQAELQTHVDATGSRIIEVRGNWSLPELTVRVGEVVTLTTPVGQERLLTLSSPLELTAGTLILAGDIILHGHGVVVNGGTLQMQDSSTITGVQGRSAVEVRGAESAFYLLSGYIRGNEIIQTVGLGNMPLASEMRHVAGVWVHDGATFEMRGGKVIENEVEVTATSPTSISGARHLVGGVWVNNGTFTMTGGTIGGNRGAHAGAHLALTPGASYDFTGGVRVDGTNGVFEMTGGRIYDNDGFHGGGVFVGGTSNFTMSAGEIDNNRGDLGGGIHVRVGTEGGFTMTAGTINNNKAQYGGGIFTWSALEILPNGLLPNGSHSDLDIRAATIFYGNTARAGAFRPPANATAATNIAITAERSIWTHPLNNFDINLIGPPENTRIENLTVHFYPGNGSFDFSTVATPHDGTRVIRTVHVVPTNPAVNQLLEESINIPTANPPEAREGTVEFRFRGWICDDGNFWTNDTIRTRLIRLDPTTFTASFSARVDVSVDPEDGEIDLGVVVDDDDYNHHLDEDGNIVINFPNETNPDDVDVYVPGNWPDPIIREEDDGSVTVILRPPTDNNIVGGPDDDDETRYFLRPPTTIVVEDEETITVTVPPGDEYDICEEEDDRRGFVVVLPDYQPGDTIIVTRPPGWSYSVSEPDADGSVTVTITPPIIIDVEDEDNIDVDRECGDYIREPDDENGNIIITLPDVDDDTGVVVNVPPCWDYSVSEPDEDGNVTVTLIPPSTTDPCDCDDCDKDDCICGSDICDECGEYPCICCDECGEYPCICDENGPCDNEDCDCEDCDGTCDGDCGDGNGGCCPKPCACDDGDCACPGGCDGDCGNTECDCDENGDTPCDECGEYPCICDENGDPCDNEDCDCDDCDCEYCDCTLPERQAYLIGGPDGTIRPRGNITRAEVATIFFRVIEEEDRENYWHQDNTFHDVYLQRWFNNSISTTTNMGLFQGVDRAGTRFEPNRSITRAEVAAVIVRFMDPDTAPPANNLFNDISGHWAQTYINIAAANDWVQGPRGHGGPFEPNRPITRAEVAAMINRVFLRLPYCPEDLLYGDMNVWPDNLTPIEGRPNWSYLYIQAASNSYTFTMHDNERNETWHEIIEDRDWTMFQRPEISATLPTR